MPERDPSTRLIRRRVGPYVPDGGVNYRQNPLRLADNEWVELVNFTPAEGRLSVRAMLTDPITLSPSATGYVNGLSQALFENSSAYLIAHDKAHIWSYDGAVVRNHSVSATGFTTSGSNGSPWWGTMASDTYYACNGDSAVVWWDGNVSNRARPCNYQSGYTAYDGTSGTSATLLRARYLQGWAGRLFAGWTLEGGVSQTVRLRWTENKTSTNWSTALGGGFVDLADTPGEITGLSVLGSNLVIYKDDAIILSVETGDPNFPISFGQWLNIGCVSGQSVQNLGAGRQAFLGFDNVYVIGDGGVQGIGDVIWPALAAAIDWSNPRQVVSWTQPERNLYCLYVPRADSSWPALYAFNWAENRWHTQHYYSTLIAASRVVTAGATTIDSVSATIDSITTRTIDSYAPQGGAAVPFVCAASADVCRLGGGSSDYPHSAIPTIYGTSKQWWFNPGGRATVFCCRVIVNAEFDGGLVLSVSTDGGAGFEAVASGSFTAGNARLVKLYFTSTATTHYFRLGLIPTTKAWASSSGPDLESFELVSIEWEVLDREEIR